MRQAVPAGLAILLALAVSGVAQTDAGPRFDVASIRSGGEFDPQNFLRTRGGPGTGDPGRITYSQMLLDRLIWFAYGTEKLDQVICPAWMSEPERFFTITATMPPDTTKEQLGAMLQNLLIERFHLVVHHETRIFPGYDLVIAPGGLKIRAWTPDTDTTETPYDPAATDAQGFAFLPRNKLGSPYSFPSGLWGIARLTNRTSISDFASRLGGFINLSTGQAFTASRPRVVDQTGLTGIYEFRLAFLAGSFHAGDQEPPPPDAAGVAGIAGAGSLGEGAPTLFAALEKELGLKLVKTKGVPVDVVVVDHMDKLPTEN